MSTCFCIIEPFQNLIGTFKNFLNLRKTLIESGKIIFINELFQRV